MKTSAFTLAEVLLTLAIIGVVAALTIPAVIIKVQQDQYVVGLKKAYNTLKSVEREAVQEHGEIKNWTWISTLSDFDKYFKPHFDILKDCGLSSDDGCFASTYLKPSGSETYRSDINGTGFSKIVTSDGISYAYVNYTAGIIKGVILVDVNGKKGPNRNGRDLYNFVIYDKVGIKPQGSYDINGNPEPRDNEELTTACKTTGNECASKVLSEGAINY